jgi:DNA-binding MltR family transcriptional regulator
MARPPKPPDREASPRFKKREKPNAKARPFAGQPSREEFNEVIKEIEGSSARGSAILAVNYVENVLRFFIRIRLVKMSNDHFDKLCDRDGPIGSFSQTIELSYALGIINSTFLHDLRIIRKIRNDFAHTLRSLEFDHKDIVRVKVRVKLSLKSSRRADYHLPLIAINTYTHVI